MLPPGAKVTCENGHYICTVNHDLVANRKMIKSKWFTDFAPEHYVPGPGDGAKECICGICGAHWIDERPGYRPDGTPAMLAKLHIDKKGWWP